MGYNKSKYRKVRFVFLVCLIAILSGCGNKERASKNNGEYEPADFKSKDGSFHLCEISWGSEQEKIETSLNIEFPSQPMLSNDIYSMYEIEKPVLLCGYEAYLQTEFQENGPVIDHGLSMVSFQIQFENDEEALVCYENLLKEFSKCMGDTSDTSGSDDKLNIKFHYVLWEHFDKEHTVLQLSTMNTQVIVALGLNN